MERSRRIYTKEERATHRQEAWRLRKEQKFSVARIASELKLCPSQVSKILSLSPECDVSLPLPDRLQYMFDDGCTLNRMIEVVGEEHAEAIREWYRHASGPIGLSSSHPAGIARRKIEDLEGRIHGRRMS